MSTFTTSHRFEDNSTHNPEGQDRRPRGENSGQRYDEFPFVSIIIPCLDEEGFIELCLDSVIANDYPKDRLEVLVIDGISEDGTRGIVQRYAQRYPLIRLLDNPRKITATALNAGIANAKGEIIMRMDAHSAYDRNYISKCVKALNEYEADNVGGTWKIIPRTNTLLGKGIAKALSHPFGIGNAHYRLTNGSEKPRWVDTVPYFCCRKVVFQDLDGIKQTFMRREDIEFKRGVEKTDGPTVLRAVNSGPFNEALPRGDDMEFNVRFRKAGLRTLLVPDIICYYYARSDMKSFCAHNWLNGVWAVLPFADTDVVPVYWRHLVPLAFVVSLTGSALLGLVAKPFAWLILAIGSAYGITNLVSSFQIAWRERDPSYLGVMPFVFATLHVGYGLGSLWGVIKVAGKPQFWKKLFKLAWIG